MVAGRLPRTGPGWAGADRRANAGSGHAVEHFKFGFGVQSSLGTSLAVRRLGLHASTAGDTGSIPGGGTKILQNHAARPKKKKKRKKKK